MLIPNSDQQCLDSWFVKLQSRGWLAVFETVAVMEVVWIGGSQRQSRAGWWAELRIDLGGAHRAQLYEDRKQSSFLCAGRLCEYFVLYCMMWESGWKDGVESDVYLMGKFI